MVPDTIHSKLLLEDPKLVIQQTEQLPLAPGTFAIVGDEIIIDDYLQDKFAIYQGGKRITDFDEPVPVVDFAIRDGKWYLLDTDSTVTIYTRTTKGLKQIREIKLAKGESEYNSLYFESSNLIAYNGDKVLVDGLGPVLPDPETTKLDHAFHLTDGNVNATIPVKYAPFSIDRLALTDQYVFYEIADWDTHHDNLSRDFIVQFTLDGQLVHTYAFYPHGNPDDGRQFVVNDGKVYQMWISSKTVKVFLIEPNG
jgi:hypothetical protein